MSPITGTLLKGIHITAPVLDEYTSILTANALEFIAHLHRNFNDRRKEFLSAQVQRQKEINKYMAPELLPLIKYVREGNWSIAPFPNDFLNKQVEIIIPSNRKTMINTLNSGTTCMVNFANSNSSFWRNIMEGQINLRDAAHGTVTYYNETNRKTYQLNENTAALIVHPRGWHSNETHVSVDDEFISASIFDFGLYFYHNVHALVKKGTAPYFYLPKTENHLDTRLWNDLFIQAQKLLNIPVSTIKATILIKHQSFVDTNCFDEVENVVIRRLIATNTMASLAEAQQLN